MKPILVLAVLFLLLPYGNSQVRVPQLTHEQMLEDFDMMTQIVCDSNPNLAINKEVFGIDIPAVLATYRKKVVPNMTTMGFVRVAAGALQACHGHHLWITAMQPFDDRRRKLCAGYVEEDAIPLSTIYQRAWAQYNIPSDVSVELLYHEGKYYNKYDFTYQDETYKRGMELLEINKRPVGEAVAGLQDVLTSFDFERKTFYGNDYSEGIRDNFYVYLKPDSQKRTRFKFRGPDGKTVEFAVNRNEVKNHIPPESILHSKRMVEFFEKSGILYIRIPHMNREDAEYIIPEVKKYVNEKQIAAAVIDIRYNPGGFDGIWTSTLNELMPGWLIKFKQGYRNTPYFRQYFTRERNVFNNFSPLPPVEKIPFLDNMEYMVEGLTLGNLAKLKPKFPVFAVAHDVYSSAGNLWAAAKASDHITLVGSRNPVIVGYIASEIHASLPNSKMIFRMTTSLDLTGAESAEDALQTKPEVEVKLSLQEKLDYHNGNASDLEEWLFNSDPYFKKVLELLNR